jgi:DNA-binding MarR family transcriptional regulator
MDRRSATLAAAASDELIGDLPLEQFLTYRLALLTNRLNRQAQQLLEEAAGLRLPEWRCLAIVARHGRLTLTEIAEITGMDAALISRTMKALVDKGYVLATRDQRDRRLIHVTLTAKGRRINAKVLPVMQRRQQHLLGALTPAERRTMYRAMDRLSDILDNWDQHGHEKD